MFTRISVKTHGNYKLVTVISEYIINNRVSFQGMSCTINKCNFDTDKNRIKGQDMKLSSGMTIFWYNGSLFWAVTSVTINSRGFDITNIVINSFRWNSNKMEDFILDMSSEKGKPILYTYQGYWMRTQKIIKITQDTYISNNGTLEKVESYIQSFIESQQDYSDRQRPYKTGILLEGPPGVGKSTLIMYLAHRFDRPVYLLFASDMSKGDDIAQIINDIPSNAILLFEDFDGVDSLTSERDDEDDDDKPRRSSKRKKLSAEGLLKKLQSTFDGFLSPNNGLIYFINTNHVEKIDDTLIRDGRIDLRVTFTYATDDWIRTLFLKEFPKATPQQLDYLTLALKDYDVIQSKFSHIVSTVKPLVKAEMEKGFNVTINDSDDDAVICDIAIGIIVDKMLDKRKTE
jgi:hypothetical protein